MKTIDVIVCALLIVGGLNWGLVGAFDFNLVDTVFGGVSWIIYSIVGLAALYEVVCLRTIARRWHMHLHSASRA